MTYITIIAIDADDTLRVNEPDFQEVGHTVAHPHSYEMGNIADITSSPGQ